MVELNLNYADLTDENKLNSDWTVFKDDNKNVYSFNLISLPFSDPTKFSHYVSNEVQQIINNSNYQYHDAVIFHGNNVSTQIGYPNLSNEQGISYLVDATDIRRKSCVYNNFYHTTNFSFLLLPNIFFNFNMSFNNTKFTNNLTFNTKNQTTNCWAFLVTKDPSQSQPYPNYQYLFNSKTYASTLTNSSSTLTPVEIPYEMFGLCVSVNANKLLDLMLFFVSIDKTIGKLFVNDVNVPGVNIPDTNIMQGDFAGLLNVNFGDTVTVSFVVNNIVRNKTSIVLQNFVNTKIVNQYTPELQAIQQITSPLTLNNAILYWPFTESFTVTDSSGTITINNGSGLYTGNQNKVTLNFA